MSSFTGSRQHSLVQSFSLDLDVCGTFVFGFSAPLHLSIIQFFLDMNVL